MDCVLLCCDTMVVTDFWSISPPSPWITTQKATIHCEFLIACIVYGIKFSVPRLRFQIPFALLNEGRLLLLLDRHVKGSEVLYSCCIE